MTHNNNDALPLHQTISIATLFLLVLSGAMTLYSIKHSNWKHEVITARTKPMGAYDKFFFLHLIFHQKFSKHEKRPIIELKNKIVFQIFFFSF